MGKEKTITDDEKIDKIFKEIGTYKQANKAQRDDINDIYNVYIGKMENVKKVPYKSQENIPKLRTEIAYIVPFIFSGNPEFEIEGEGEEDKDIAAILERIVNYRLQTIPKAYEKLESWVKQSVTFGTSLLKVIWKFQTKQNKDGTETPIKDEPDLEVPNILDCFYNPIIAEVEDQNSIIFRSVIPIEDVKNNQTYDYTNKLGELNREKVEPGDSNVDNYNSSQQTKGDLIDLQKSSEGTIEIYERITKDRIQTVANGKERLILRDKEFGYGFINAVKLIHEPNAIPNRFEGLGVGQNTLGLGKLFYKVINQTIDAVTLGNNPMFMFKKGSVPDKAQLVGKPGGGIEVDTDDNLNNAIVPVTFPDIKQGAVALTQKIDDEHKRASGANDLIQGSASNKTLGQDQMASSYSSNRFELISRRFKQALSDVARMIIEMEIKNLQSPDSAILRIFPLEIRKRVYELLINEAPNIKYNIKIKGETTIAKNKDIQIKQLTDAYNLFGMALPPENQMEWARKILELRGIDEIDKLIPSAEKIQQQQQAINPQMLQEGFPQQI